MFNNEVCPEGPMVARNVNAAITKRRRLLAEANALYAKHKAATERLVRFATRDNASAFTKAQAKEAQYAQRVMETKIKRLMKEVSYFEGKLKELV